MSMRLAMMKKMTKPGQATNKLETEESDEENSN